MSYPHVSIIILNWNKWADTIECLESVLKSDYPNFNIILVDNYSVNDSVSKIQTWAKMGLEDVINTNFPDLIFPLEKKPIDLMTVKISNRKVEIPIFKDKKPKILFLLSDENYGFAVANNIAINLVLEIYQSQYVFLLNNDTVIEKEALKNLVAALENNPQYSLAQSTIYYYNDKGKIANAGGKLFFWGKGKYYTKINPDEIKEIGFINGCALLLSKKVIEKYGVFSENFFFGEEDFEYSFRLSLNKVKNVCVENSRVYHKISISSNHLLGNDKGRSLILSVLNRIADMRNYYPRFLWIIWRYVTIFYYFLFLMIIKNRISIKSANKYLKYILKKSRFLDNVDKTVYQEIIEKKWH
ncbi:MAG TPA: glycosyltransferase family 2 protein [Candidatus Marinimicrobia bacterium]|nr:glycosyltransferase family 2 protein [Candidatus Neomarinimicrobiota bacterium]HRS51661.1 glycosyltransferase family 2 protein [Candidatus Neomarinimicrobiota bacterium]HRU92189.1 glycosyltransferase family 2 protein [Candidatus Neomarinimicrobiota bacterium]